MTRHDDVPRWDAPQGQPVPPELLVEQPPELLVEQPPKPKRRWLWPTLAGAIGLVIGGLAGGSSAEPTNATPSPSPAVTVTQQAQAKTVTKTVVPKACTVALDEADKTLAMAGEIMYLAQDGFAAVADFDVAALEEAAAGMQAYVPRFSAQANEYRSARDECRAAP